MKIMIKISKSVCFVCFSYEFIGLSLLRGSLKFQVYFDANNMLFKLYERIIHMTDKCKK